MTASVFQTEGSGSCPYGSLVLDPTSLSRTTFQRAWSRLPSQWILDGGLRLFRNQPAYIGRSAAALKLLLTVALTAKDAPDAFASEYQGTALLSYDDLCHLAGLSRPLIVQGKKLLCVHGLIRTSHEGRGQQIRYALANYGRGHAWARISLPATEADGERARLSALCGTSCRQSDDLNTLKVYLALCALRGKGSNDVSIDLNAISQIANIFDKKLGTAIDKLSVKGFLRFPVNQ